jgi:hypothetical protein
MFMPKTGAEASVRFARDNLPPYPKSLQPLTFAAPAVAADVAGYHLSQRPLMYGVLFNRLPPFNSSDTSILHISDRGRLRLLQRQRLLDAAVTSYDSSRTTESDPA